RAHIFRSGRRYVWHPAIYTEDIVMLAVIFEVVPQAGEKKTYLEIAEKLKHELDRIDGFLSIERFESLTNPGKILSLSFWRDEEAVKHWRNVEGHRAAQAKGRGGVR